LKSDRTKWNRRYSEKDPGRLVPEIVRTYVHRAPAGRALDIACGAGAVSLFMADRGFAVDAVDISDVALAGFARQHPAIQGVCADLDVFDLATDRYQLIANIRYLNRRLYPQIIAALVPGGVLMFETFMKSRREEMDRGFKREYLLDEQELPRVFAPLETLYYQEADTGDTECPPRMASFVGVKR
jgi:2-polyprenyl-3-methyl-5-hydroxy-6-metoxy-1,4-benzoquinol methylase